MNFVEFLKRFLMVFYVLVQREDFTTTISGADINVEALIGGLDVGAPRF